ncbi:MAG: hypothetical protein V9E89_02300 [Ilumatobacteraceae bacterium]
MDAEHLAQVLLMDPHDGTGVVDDPVIALDYKRPLRTEGMD